MIHIFITLCLFFIMASLALSLHIRPTYHAYVDFHVILHTDFFVE